MADVVKQVLGPVSAYALAKQQGYSGTLEEWAQDQANAGANAAAAKKSAEEAAQILAQVKQNNKTYDEEIGSIKDTKADAIRDTSARAASHTLHAQRGPLGVTIFGKTTETGSGGKSPDNPYVISGVDAAHVYAGGKNLFDFTNSTRVGVGGAYSEITGGARINVATPGTYKPVYFVLPNALLGKTLTFAANASPSGENNAGVRLSVIKKTGTHVKNIAEKYGTSGRIICTGTAPDGINDDEYLAAALYGTFNVSGVVGEYVDYTNIQIEIGSTATAYEPYTANVITPPLLPDGAPLHGNGTVDDIIENDVLSGCDRCVIFDGSDDENWKLDAVNIREAFRIDDEVLADRADRKGSQWSSEIGNLYSNWLPSEGGSTADTYGKGAAMRGTAYNGSFIVFYPAGTFSNVESFKAHLAANPLIVYYRSTDYTPDKDLRVCKTVRNWANITLDGDEEWFSGGVGVFQTKGYHGSYSKTVDQVSNWITFTGDNGAADPRFTVDGAGLLWIVYSEYGTDMDDFKAMLSEKPLNVVYRLATSETYMTDPLTLRKPDTLTTDTVTVTGSGETAVEYPHTTKHYIDSQIAAAVALALGN